MGNNIKIMTGPRGPEEPGQPPITQLPLYLIRPLSGNRYAATRPPHITQAMCGGRVEKSGGGNRGGGVL